MNWTNVLGLLAFLSSYLLLTVGLPKQIWLNHRRKSAEGIDSSLIYSLLAVYFIWALYGWAKMDWPLIGANVPGIALVLVLIFQAYWYRKRT